MSLGRRADVVISWLLRAGCHSGELSGWVLRWLRGPGSAHSALSGGVWFAQLGGAVAALWPGASLVCRVFPSESSLENEKSATYCSLVFGVGLSSL